IQPGQPIDVLLVGSDRRTGAELAKLRLEGGDVPDGSRSDTIMVLRLDRAHDSLKLLSIPRDLWVHIPRTNDFDRINSAYGKSRQTLVDAVMSLGIPVHHYLEVRFDGLRRLVDEVGGVHLAITRPIRDVWTGLSLAEGCTLVNGTQA